LDAELAELAAEEEAAACEVREEEPGPPAMVLKERWRKRKKEEAMKEEVAEGSAEGTGRPNGALNGVSTSPSTSTSVVRDDEARASVPNQSKRARKRERKRVGRRRRLGFLEDGNGGSPEEEQHAAGVDEVASGSGSSDLSLSPSLAPTVAVEAPDARKRKRQPDAEEELESETELDAPAASPCTDSEPYDPTLLAVVGVLAHVRTVGNVAAWVRSGGLAAIEQDADGVNPTAEAQTDAKEAPLPSDPAQWFTSRHLLTAWAARGRAALAELGIDAAPGVE
jgi:hypothetical protein